MTSQINKRILVIEDEVPMLEALVNTLEENEFLTLKATDGEAGFAVALKEHPDLILLDLILPKMDGMTVMKKLRQDSWGKDVPIIIVTNRDSDDDILKGVVENQPSYYLKKAEFTPIGVAAKAKELLNIS